MTEEGEIFTVIGVMTDGAAEVAGIVAGEVETFGDYGWRVFVQASGPEEAGLMAAGRIDAIIQDALTQREASCLERSFDCAGPVGYRMALSSTGRSFPRCDHHWDLRLRQEIATRTRYPVNAPSDFDPSYAGERWDEED